MDDSKNTSFMSQMTGTKIEDGIDLQTKIDFLKSLPFFRGKVDKDSDFVEIAKVISYTDVDKDFLIGEYGTYGSEFFFIVKGSVQVWKPNSEIQKWEKKYKQYKLMLQQIELQQEHTLKLKMFEDRKYFLSYGKYPLPDSSDSEAESAGKSKDQQEEAGGDPLMIDETKQKKVLKKGVSDVTAQQVTNLSLVDPALKTQKTKMRKNQSMVNNTLHHNSSNNLLFNRKGTTGKANHKKRLAGSTINEETTTEGGLQDTSQKSLSDSLMSGSEGGQSEIGDFERALKVIHEDEHFGVSIDDKEVLQNLHREILEGYETVVKGNKPVQPTIHNKTEAHKLLKRVTYLSELNDRLETPGHQGWSCDAKMDFEARERRQLVRKMKKEGAKGSSLDSIHDFGEDSDLSLKEGLQYQKEQLSKQHIKLKELPMEEIQNLTQVQVDRIDLSQPKLVDMTPEQIKNAQEASWFVMTTILGEKQHFGDVAFAFEDGLRRQTFFAQEKCTLARISKTQYQRLIAKITNKNRQEMNAFLHTLPYLKHWTSRGLNKLQSAFLQQDYIRNQVVYKEDTPADCVYIVQSGEFIQTKLEEEKVSKEVKVQRLLGPDPSEEQMAQFLRTDQLDKDEECVVDSALGDLMPQTEAQKNDSTNTHKVQKRKITGNFQLMLISRGQMFGEDDLLDDKFEEFSPHQRFASVKCISMKGILYRLDANTFYHFFKQSEETWREVKIQLAIRRAMTNNRIQMIQGVYDIKPRDIMHAVKIEGNLGASGEKETKEKGGLSKEESGAFKGKNRGRQGSQSPANNKKYSLSPKRDGSKEILTIQNEYFGKESIMGSDQRHIGSPDNINSNKDKLGLTGGSINYSPGFAQRDFQISVNSQEGSLINPNQRREQGNSPSQKNNQFASNMSINRRDSTYFSQNSPSKPNNQLGSSRNHQSKLGKSSTKTTSIMNQPKNSKGKRQLDEAIQGLVEAFGLDNSIPNHLKTREHINQEKELAKAIKKAQERQKVLEEFQRDMQVTLPLNTEVHVNDTRKIHYPQILKKYKVKSKNPLLIDDFRVALKCIVGKKGNEEIFLKNRKKGNLNELYSDSENEQDQQAGVSSRNNANQEGKMVGVSQKVNKNSNHRLADCTSTLSSRANQSQILLRDFQNTSSNQLYSLDAQSVNVSARKAMGGVRDGRQKQIGTAVGRMARSSIRLSQKGVDDFAQTKQSYESAPFNSFQSLGNHRMNNYGGAGQQQLYQQRHQKQLMHNKQQQYLPQNQQQLNSVSYPNSSSRGSSHHIQQFAKRNIREMLNIRKQKTTMPHSRDSRQISNFKHQNQGMIAGRAADGGRTQPYTNGAASTSQVSLQHAVRGGAGLPGKVAGQGQSRAKNGENNINNGGLNRYESAGTLYDIPPNHYLNSGNGALVGQAFGLQRQSVPEMQKLNKLRFTNAVSLDQTPLGGPEMESNSGGGVLSKALNQNLSQGDIIGQTGGVEGPADVIYKTSSAQEYNDNSLVNVSQQNTNSNIRLQNLQATSVNSLRYNMAANNQQQISQVQLGSNFQMSRPSKIVMPCNTEDKLRPKYLGGMNFDGKGQHSTSSQDMFGKIEVVDASSLFQKRQRALQRQPVKSVQGRKRFTVASTFGRRPRKDSSQFKSIGQNFTDSFPSIV